MCSITNCLWHLFCIRVPYVQTTAGHPAWCCGDFFCFTCDSFSCSASLKEYKNEDVAVGSWMLGLDTEHIDDRNLCCAFNTGIFLSWSFLRTRYQCLVAVVLSSVTIRDQSNCELVIIFLHFWNCCYDIKFKGDKVVHMTESSVPNCNSFMHFLITIPSQWYPTLLMNHDLLEILEL